MKKFSGTIVPEEDLVREHSDQARLGKISRRARVSPMRFLEIARRLGAKIEEGPDGEFVQMHMPAGRVFLVSDPICTDDAYSIE